MSARKWIAVVALAALIGGGLLVPTAKAKHAYVRDLMPVKLGWLSDVYHVPSAHMPSALPRHVITHSDKKCPHSVSLFLSSYWLMRWHTADHRVFYGFSVRKDRRMCEREPFLVEDFPKNPVRLYSREAHNNSCMDTDVCSGGLPVVCNRHLGTDHNVTGGRTMKRSRLGDLEIKPRPVFATQNFIGIVSGPNRVTGSLQGSDKKQYADTSQEYAQPCGPFGPPSRLSYRLLGCQVTPIRLIVALPLGLIGYLIALRGLRDWSPVTTAIGAALVVIAGGIFVAYI